MSNHHPKRTPLMVPMQPRSPDEVHRASTPLELLFDLVFVVAVALASARLHHGIVENHVSHAIVSFVMVFFPIWWAWMNFSWFASAYDTDDVPYRLLTMLQLAGALTLAAGVPAAFDSGDFMVVTLGYSVMRVASISQWFRAWLADKSRRQTTGRYIVGLFLVQLGWLALLVAPASFKTVGFITLVVAELMVPLWAESTGKMTPWHPEHIVERYGLFTIIVLGESILSASMAIQAAMTAGALDAKMLYLIIGGVLIVFTMWWSYFQQTEHNINESLCHALFWGYGHFFIFASAAAVGAGLASSVDAALGLAHVSQTVINAAVAVPVAVFVLSLGVVHGRLRRGGPVMVAFFIAIAALMATIWTDSAVFWVGVVMSVFLGFKLWANRSTTI
jgi:low temperature requirement protein LtrA